MTLARLHHKHVTRGTGRNPPPNGSRAQREQTDEATQYLGQRTKVLSCKIILLLSFLRLEYYYGRIGSYNIGSHELI